jgi:hypothetical protein
MRVVHRTGAADFAITIQRFLVILLNLSGIIFLLPYKCAFSSTTPCATPGYTVQTYPSGESGLETQAIA